MSKDKKEDVRQFLDSLDAIPTASGASKSRQPSSRPTPSKPSVPGPGAAATGEAAEALAFLDGLTQQPSRPARVLTPGPRVRNAADATRKSANASPAPGGLKPSTSTTNPSRSRLESSSMEELGQEEEVKPSGSGWGWGSVWNVASAAVAQAKTVVEEQAKNLPNDQAKKWGEGMITYVKQAQLDKIANDLKTMGSSTLTQMMNAVAPPIAEHEVIQVWLSHDMKGYEGVESLVYRSLARIMEQVDGGDLVVNRGNESKPKSETKERNMGAIDGLEPAYKLAVAELDGMVRSDILNAPKKASLDGNKENPTTYSSVFLRIQPFYSITPPFMTSISKEESTAPARQLQFFLYLTDPNHSITHSTVSQVIPAEWLDIWDEYDWVEDLVVEALRVSVEIVGEQYLSSRMNWAKKLSSSNTEKKPAA